MKVKDFIFPMKLISSRFAPCALFMTLLGGCSVVYVDPAETNAVSADAYTRAESIEVAPRLVASLLADPVFAQHYAAKVSQRDGAVPLLQVAPIDNLSTARAPTLPALRRDLESALRSSGRFVLSGDSAACDYVLRGEYRDIRDGARTTHQIALRMHDLAADLDVWTGSDEIAKE